MSKLPLADPLGFQSTSITENLKCTRRLWHTPAKNPTNSNLRFVAKDICHLSSACSLLGVFNSLMHHINYESIRITFTASCRFSSFSEIKLGYFYLILSLEFLFIQHTQINIYTGNPILEVNFKSGKLFCHSLLPFFTVVTVKSGSAVNMSRIIRKTVER